MGTEGAPSRGDQRSAQVVSVGAPHSADAASLHASGISTGFLSSLGRPFLTSLYAVLPECTGAFGFAAIGTSGAVAGFIACACDTGSVFREALRRGWFRMGLALCPVLMRPGVLRRVRETLRYPATVSTCLPRAEILSVAVDGNARRLGVGRALMDAALDEFARRGISELKVAVGADNAPANRYYVRCGFALAATIHHHGAPTNVYVIDISDRADPTTTE